jgi:flagellum-specific peptidoglycan hydrolase FlgJ
MGPNYPHIATCLEDYAKLLRKTNREAEAIPLEARAKKIRAGQK